MIKSKKTNKVDIEIGRNYFSTPNTSFDKQRQISEYDSFDTSNDSYRKSTARIVVRRYTVK